MYISRFISPRHALLLLSLLRSNVSVLMYSNYAFPQSVSFPVRCFTEDPALVKRSLTQPCLCAREMLQNAYCAPQIPVCLSSSPLSHKNNSQTQNHNSFFILDRVLNDSHLSCQGRSPNPPHVHSESGSRSQQVAPGEPRTGPSPRPGPFHCCRYCFDLQGSLLPP